MFASRQGLSTSRPFTPIAAFINSGSAAWAEHLTLRARHPYGLLIAVASAAPEKPWPDRGFCRICRPPSIIPAQWSPCGPQSHPRSHLPEDNDASKTAKLLRVPVDMSSVLTASRLLRADAMPTGPARYVSGWELKKCLETTANPCSVSGWELAKAKPR